MMTAHIFDFDYIAGDCFIMGEDFNTGEWRSLNEVEIEKYKRELDGMNVGGAFMANNVEQKPIKLFGEDGVHLTPAQQKQSIFC